MPASPSFVGRGIAKSSTRASHKQGIHSIREVHLWPLTSTLSIDEEIEILRANISPQSPCQISSALNAGESLSQIQGSYQESRGEKTLSVTHTLMSSTHLDPALSQQRGMSYTWRGEGSQLAERAAYRAFTADLSNQVTEMPRWQGPKQTIS